MDVPAPFAGTIKEIQVSVGDRVSQGRVLLTMEQSGSSRRRIARLRPRPRTGRPPRRRARRGRSSAVEAEEASAPRRRAARRRLSPRRAARRDSRRTDGAVYASPAVRRLARERGIDLHQVQGSGRKGRITREDVERIRASPDGPAPASRGRPRFGSGPGRPGRRSTSRSSARSSASSGRGSSGSRRRTWRATG